ncbi:MAG: hypothetical protein IJO48_00500 [Clostridia bacterium]|nr:hypothetical protein [Clostridia bacterium]
MSKNRDNEINIDEFIPDENDCGIDEIDIAPSIAKKEKRSVKNVVVMTISIILAIAVCGCYVYWLCTGNPATDAFSRLSAFACAALFGLCAVFAVRPVADMFSGTDYNDLVVNDKKIRSKNFFDNHPYITVFALVVITRFLIYVIAYFVCLHENGYTGGLFETLRKTWQHSTDSNSYIGIAENWYTNDITLDRYKHIVFFPMYPLLVKLVSFVVGDTFASAIIVSNVCAGFAGVFMYQLALVDMPKKDALRVTKYLFLLPAACFFGTHMSESLFLMLCVLCVLFVRKKNFILACIVGAFASFTRSPGVLLLVPIFIEFVAEQCRIWREGDKQLFWKKFWQRGFSMLIVPVGIVAYLVINYTVWGDPFYFMEIQKSNWSQSFGWIFNTASYLVSYLQSYFEQGRMNLVMGLSIPNVVCIFGSLAIMLATIKKQRPSYTIYFLVYFFIVIGVQWLLSAPRYLSVAFPLAFALGLLTKNKIIDIIVTIICILFMLWYAIMLALGYPVY